MTRTVVGDKEEGETENPQRSFSGILGSYLVGDETLGRGLKVLEGEGNVANEMTWKSVL